MKCQAHGYQEIKILPIATVRTCLLIFPLKRFLYILNPHIKTENKSKLNARRGEKKLYTFLILNLVFTGEQRNACCLEIKSSGTKLWCYFSLFTIGYLHQLKIWFIMLFKYDDNPENFLMNESPSSGMRIHS